MGALDALIDDLEVVRESVSTRPGQLSRTYRFGARVLRVNSRASSLAHMPDDGLVRLSGDHPIHTPVVDLFIIEPDDAARLAFPSNIVMAPYGGLVDSVETPWLILGNPDTGKVLALDTIRQVALYYPGSNVPPRDRAEFCRPLLHWLAILDGNVVIHAGGIAKDGHGLLIAGAGNAGKTTLTRVCLSAGFDLLGDNVVEVSAGGAPRLHPVYPTFKVRRDPILAVPQNWPVPQWDDEAEKDIYFLGDAAFAMTSKRSHEHVATLILDEQGPPRPEPIAAARAFFLMAPNTVAQFPLLEKEVLTRTGTVVNSAPTFVAGRMPIDRIVGIVESILLPSPSNGGPDEH